VCINYRTSAEAAESLEREIHAVGGRAVSVRADVGNVSQARALVERATGEIGSLSILVNNAGVAYRATLETFDPAAMESMRRTNVDGLIHVTRMVVAGMKERRYGRIINITSIAGHGTSLPGNAFYAATKAAVSILTRRFAMECGRHGITVNAVAPGFIMTELVKEGRTEQEYRALVEMVSERSMVGRMGDPADIASAVAFLAAPESGFITAQVITVDGGRMDYIGHG